jgi:meso-butanediol dehydrogenase/(S,S)-butanediol dehydrogenase/diacetyl reductase
VVASDSDEHGPEQLVNDTEVPHGGAIIGCRCDVMDADEVQALVEYAVQDVRQARRHDQPRREYERTSGTVRARHRAGRVARRNRRCPERRFLRLRGSHPHLVETKGCVVNTASISGMGGDYAIPAYDAGKAGVINLTKAMAHDHGEQGIRSNCLSPGGITYASGNPMASMEGHYLERVPLRRFATPDDIAAMAFLASEDASHITGHNLVVDGGLTRRAASTR